MVPKYSFLKVSDFFLFLSIYFIVLKITFLIIIWPLCTSVKCTPSVHVLNEIPYQIPYMPVVKEFKDFKFILITTARADLMLFISTCQKWLVQYINFLDINNRQLGFFRTPLLKQPVLKCFYKKLCTCC